MYSQYLALSGFRVAEAKNGYEAIEKATAYRPDVVLIDLYLPGLDGWEVAQRLKADPRTRDAVLIAFTAHSSPDAAARAREAGCATFLTKPCLEDTLVGEIRRLLDGGRPSMEKRAASRPAQQFQRAIAADQTRGSASGTEAPTPSASDDSEPS